MIRRLSLLMAVLFAAIIYSCDHTLDVSENFEFEEDASVLAQRIKYINTPIDLLHQAKSLVHRQAKSHLSSFVLTPQYAIEDGYTTLIDGVYQQDLEINEGELVCITATGEFLGGVILNGGTLVVLGKAEFTSLSALRGTIINNPSGMIVSQGFSLNKNVTFANYGSLVLPAWASVVLNGQLENYSELSFKTLYINNDGKFYNSGTMNVVKNIAIDAVCHNYGTLVVGGFLYLNTNGELFNNCSIVVGDNATLDGVLINKSYLEVGNCFYINANSACEMQGGALVKAKRIFINDDITSDGSAVAVIYAADRIFHNGGEVAENLVLTSDESSCYLPSSDCSPGIGVEPRFTLLFEIEPPMFQGQLLSATCVQVVDNMAFVSYHMNGEDYGAAIDVLELDGANEPAIIQTLYSSAFDFNELKLDDVLSRGKRRMWVVGALQMTQHNNFKSAAVVLEVMLRNDVIFDFYHNIIDLKGSSANSIVKRGDELIAVSGSNGGLTVIDYDSFSFSNFIPLKNAKYFECLGDDAISLTASVNGAQLRHYRAGDTYYSPDITTSIDPISPYDGKLVVHLDNDKSYISCATQGLKIFKTSTLEQAGAYQSPSNSTNCVTSDDDFVYLANGAQGLVILGKDKLNKIGEYISDGSANFVSAFDKYIFLADGRGGFKVLYREQ